MNRVKEQRKKSGMSLEQLSEKSGISVKELTKIENPDFVIDKLSAYSAAHIAEALGCYISDLIYNDNQ